MWNNFNHQDLNLICCQLVLHFLLTWPVIMEKRMGVGSLDLWQTIFPRLMNLSKTTSLFSFTDLFWLACYYLGLSEMNLTTVGFYMLHYFYVAYNCEVYWTIILLGLTSLLKWKLDTERQCLCNSDISLVNIAYANHPTLKLLCRQLLPGWTRWGPLFLRHIELHDLEFHEWFFFYGYEPLARKLLLEWCHENAHTKKNNNSKRNPYSITRHDSWKCI